MLQGAENSVNNNIGSMWAMLVVMFMKKSGTDLDRDVTAEKKVKEREESRKKTKEVNNHPHLIPVCQCQH